MVRQEQGRAEEQLGTIDKIQNLTEATYKSMYKNIALLGLFILCSSCQPTEYRFAPSQTPAFLPSTNDFSFSGESSS